MFGVGLRLGQPHVSALRSVTSIAGVTGVWLADRGVTLTSSKVSAWASQKTGPTDFSQGTAGSRPVVAPNVFGSNPSIQFDGVDDFMTGGALSQWVSASAGAVYVLCKPLVATSNGVSLHQNHALWGNSGPYVALVVKTGPLLGATNLSGASYDEITTATALATQVSRWRHGGGVVGVRRDAGTEATVASGDTKALGMSNNVQIGALSVYLNGHIGAIVAMNTTPTADEDSKILALLNSYGGI